jgi:hypothetical protein
MKPLLRLVLALAVALVTLAGLPPVAADGGPFAPLDRQIIIGGGSFELQCAQFCAVVLCAEPQVCGVFIDEDGRRACGCHNPFGGGVL